MFTDILIALHSEGLGSLIQDYDLSSMCIMYAKIENDKAYQDFLAFRNALIANAHQEKIPDKPDLPFKIN